MIRIFTLILVLFYFSSFSQKEEKRIVDAINYGFNYGVGHEDNFLFNSKNYSYDVRLYKVQLYYPLKRRNYFSYEILVQPEINIAQHQLHNVHFVRPEEPNYIEKRALYSQKRTFKEYVLNVGFLVRKQLINSLSTYLLISVGPSYIGIESEHLAKGFAFSDNINFGLNFRISKHIILDFRSGLRHISNAGLQRPNAGYNTLNLEFGFIYKR